MLNWITWRVKDRIFVREVNLMEFTSQRFNSKSNKIDSKTEILCNSLVELEFGIGNMFLVQFNASRIPSNLHYTCINSWLMCHSAWLYILLGYLTMSKLCRFFNDLFVCSNTKKKFSIAVWPFWWRDTFLHNLFSSFYCSNFSFS